MPLEPARQGASLRSPYGLPSLRTLAARIHPFRLLIPCPMSEGDGISRYMNQRKPSPRPNLSFNPDPTVGCGHLALNSRLTVGPVNFVR